MQFDTGILQQVAKDFFADITAETMRYILFAGTTFVAFYLVGRKVFARFKIQQKYPVNKHIWRELKYSFLSLCIFALNGVFVMAAYRHGYTKMYMDIHVHSWKYFVFSVLVFIVAHDAYFYWTHRFMHLKKVYPYVHKIHHLSHDPTPWAAYAFHPVEAVIQAAIFPIMVFIMPVHPLAILAWGLYQAALNVMGHSGFEFFPAGFTSGVISKWHNTVTHHNLHHKYATGNYGLYFNFWDRVMGTNHAKYTETFEQVVASARNQPMPETQQKQPGSAYQA